MKKSQIALAAALALGSGRIALAQVPNEFIQTNLVASNASYDPQIVNPDLEDSWGIALRPPGAGGHIWIDNAFNGTASEYQGDVNGVPLHQDPLTSVSLDAPAFTDRGTPFVTGLAYDAASDLAGQAEEFPVMGPATDLDTGQDLGTVSNPNYLQLGDVANPVFSGVAITDNPVTQSQVGTAAGNHIFTADFRNNQINVFNDQWQNVTSNFNFQTPTNLVSTTGAPLHIFNIQDLGGNLYATYAAFNPNGDEGFEEIDQNGDGAVVEYSETGKLIQEFHDSTNPADELDAPWGMALAPAGFGPFGGDLLVTNFGDNGTISVFNPSDGDYLGKLDGVDGNPISIDGIWGLTFGNGVSLGDANSLYFTAGPNNEFDGLVGKLTFVPEPTSLGFIALGGVALMRRRRAKA
ncbi:MAG: TIGR03118 family protein [Tepidisphaeraceae bacterium]